MQNSEGGENEISKKIDRHDADQAVHVNQQTETT